MRSLKGLNCWIFLTATLLFCRSDGLCTFPSDFHNSVWTSTNFGTMTFKTTNVTVTKALEFGSIFTAFLSTWECFLSSSSKFIMRTTATDSSFGVDAYGYYCIFYTKQNSDSYYYEAKTDQVQTSVDFSFFSTECQSSNDASKFNVMIKDPEAAKQVCAQPILGSFAHATAGCKNGTWESACDTDKSSINVTYQTVTCKPQVYIGLSSEGFLYCALAADSSDTYYQILYNPGQTSGTDTRKFSCLTITVTNTTSDGGSIVTIEQRTCDDRTTATLTTITLTSDVLCPVITEEITTTAVAPEPPTDNTTTIIVAAVLGTLAFLVILGLVIGLCIYLNRDPNKGKPIIENTKPRFEDPDLDETIEDLEMDNASTIITRDDITVGALSPENIVARRATVANGNVVNAAPGGQNDWLNKSLNGSISNGYIGNHFNEKPGDRPAPRVHKLTPGKESMVIFNGDEKVISGNDSRVVPNEHPTARSMSLRFDQSGATTFKSLDDDGMEETDIDLPYPSVPRSKSNLMPPIETIDSPKEKH